jgi:hypothetical protein
MFAVFNKNEFKGLWHNQKTDTGWLARTCLSLGWNPLETQALWYDYNFNSRTVYVFDEEKKLLIQGPVTRQRLKPGKSPEDDDAYEDFESWETIETWLGENYSG